MQESGVVTRIDGQVAWVRVNKKSSCEHCTAGTCRIGEDGAMIEALNEVGSVVGDRVRVDLISATYVKGSLFMYGVPALALIIGAILGTEYSPIFIEGLDKELGAAIAGFGLMGISMIGVWLWSRGAEKKTEYRPVVKEIIG